MSRHYVAGAEIARSIGYEYTRDQAFLPCIRAACAAGDWLVAESILSEMTSCCWQLIGTCARDGWRADSAQATERIVEVLERKVSEDCSRFGHPTEALAYAALELGIAGHISVARVLWAKVSNTIARQKSQVELIRLLARSGRTEDACGLLDDLKYTSHKARGLAYIGRSYVDRDPPHARSLAAQAWQEINPDNLPPEFGRHWFHDETMGAIAGTVAHWDLAEADQIVESWVEKEHNREEARGEVLAAVCAADAQCAYERLTKIVAEGADRGLSGFWQALAACSEALLRLIGAEGTMDLHRHLSLIESS